MSNEMTLFGNQSNAALALLQDLEDDLTSKIAGSGGNKRISLENNVFTGAYQCRARVSHLLRWHLPKGCQVQTHLLVERHPDPRRQRPR